MKHFIKVTIFVFILIPVFLQPGNAQDRFVWQNGERVSLQVSSDRFVMQVPDSLYHEVSDLAGLQHLSERNRYQKYNKKIIWVTETTLSQMDVLRDEAGVPVYLSPLYELENEGMKHTTGELLVRWKQGLDSKQIEEMEKQYQLRRMEERRTDHLGATILYEYMPPYETTSLEVANALYESGFVQWANPNYSYALKRLSFNGGPNDALYSQQWNLPKIETDFAWDITIGSGAVVAVFDDGVDLTHDDLADNLLRDGQDNVVGHNATDRGNANDPHPDGEDAHGTAVAGISGAVTDNNEEGVAGIAADGRVMPLQMAYTHPVDPQFLETEPNWWIESLDFAVNNGADVVNMSVQLGQDDDFDDAMDNAVNTGVVLVAASGNDGWSSIVYPAINANVIAVGASIEDDTRWSNSNYDSNLDLVAPGGAPIIWTTDRPGNTGFGNEDYTEFDGTSAAAPHVAATVGLIRSINSALTPAQIRTILHNTAVQVAGMGGQGFTDEYGHGRLNAYEAVKAALPSQFNNHTFSNNTILNSAHIAGTTSISSGVTVTVPSNEIVVVQGTVNGSTNSKIAANGKLIIEAGTVLNDVEVVVENGGELVAKGEGASKIAFDGKGVVFESGSGGRLSHCTIENANRGVEINGSATPVISDCSIKNNTVGIVTNSGIGSDTQILDNYIAGNSSYGIASYYSSPTIDENYITGNTRGFLGVGSTASFYYNQVINNSYGFYLLSGSSVSDATYNQVISGGTHIFVQSPSTVQFYYNDILVVSNTDYLVRAKNSATFVGDNYWDTNGNNPSPSLFYATEDSFIFYYTTSSSPYVPEFLNTVPQQQAKVKQTACTSLGDLSNQIAAERDVNRQRAMLSGKAGCWRTKDNNSEFVQFLKEELRTTLPRDHKLYATSLEVENLFLMDQGEYDRAISNFEELQQQFSGDPLLHQHALFGLGYIHSLVKEDEQRGGHYFAELQHLYPESEMSRQAGAVAESYGFEIAFNEGNKPIAEAEETPAALGVSNYPNPFNPVTEFTYSLPQQSEVSLIVYDMLGRRVAELVNESRPAGTHRVSFDASRLSSGIYLYRLHAGSEVVTGQMTVVK